MNKYYLTRSLWLVGLFALLNGPVKAAPPIRVSISPTSASLLPGQTQQFTATVSRASNTSVRWYVNGVLGGTASTGTVSANGLYTAPSSNPSQRTVTVAATSVADPYKSASASVTIAASSTSGGGTAPTPTNVLWFADMETGNTAQWSASNGGGLYNSGSANSVASRDVAHGGSWALKMTTTTPPESGTSVTRWLEPTQQSNLTYTAWYYFPQRYTAVNYWNILQWGSTDSTGQVNPFFIVNVGNRSDGSMYFYLFDWQTRRGYTQSAKSIAPGTWLKLDATYRCASDGTGYVTVWQDGTQLFDVRNVQTRYANGDCRVSWNSLSDNLSPSAATIYIDDVSISTTGTNTDTNVVVPPTTITPPTITTTSLPGATVGNPYSHTMTASGGTAPYTWRLAGGSLPPGLSLSTAGVISGNPTTAGVFGASFQVTDASATPQTATSGVLTINVAAATSGRVIWSADVETGDTSQWYYPASNANGGEGGGEFNSGTGDSVASRDFAHSGSWSLRMRITTPPESGTRMFRWLEPHTYPKLRYSAWFYFPQRYSVGTYWNIFQWKSKTSAGQVDPFFVLNVGNRGDGSMYLYLYNWQNRQAFQQSVKNIPVGQWFKVEADYWCAADGTGRVTFWQDGTQLFDVQNVQTRYGNGDCQWSLDNYSSGLSPSTSTIYIDDAQIILK
jgi:hypothetical protein